MGVENMNLGEILKALRLYKEMSIEELAGDICSPEELRAYEEGYKYPAIDQLYKIASRLNIELNQLFDFATAGSFDYVTAVFDLIKKYKGERNYQAIYEIVQQEKSNPLFNLPKNRQFLLWHEAISEYYLNDAKEKDIAVAKLYEALNETNSSRKGLTEREVEILIAIALIEKDDNEHEEAIALLKEALDALEELPVVSESRVWLRALYGLSQCLSNLERFEESLIYSNKGINKCINEEVLYLFGEFYYQSGINYIEIGNAEKGIEYLKKSIQAFDLQNNQLFIDLVTKQLVKILN